MKCEMRKKDLYWVFAVCFIMLSSCLGDSNTRITVGEQEAVYQVRPSRGLVLSGGRLIYSSSINSLRVDAGDCFMVQYSFDTSNPELQKTDSLSVELLGEPTEVPLWTVEGTVPSDTLLTDEQYIAKIGTRTPYIKGRLFLWPQLNEPESQRDSFVMHYDSVNLYKTTDGFRTYNLYLRAIRKSEIPADADSTLVPHTEAFDIESFFNKALEMETANQSKTLTIAVNYVAKPNKDTTGVEWSILELSYPLDNGTEE